MTDTTIDLGAVLAIEESVLQSTATVGFGVTQQGFVPKPFVRLVAEKLAMARRMFGDDVDLSSASVIRKLIELQSLGEARTWAGLAAVYDNLFVVSATGEALSRLGDELGLPRPFAQARGKIKLELAEALPAAFPAITIPRGSRLSTPGGHHVATDESVTLTAAAPEREIAVVAFYPGPGHNLDPGQPNQQLDRWHPADSNLNDLNAAQDAAGKELVKIHHLAPLTGGEMQWEDLRYRQLLLRAPRSVWTVDAIQAAVSLVPGVRQVQVVDGRGGLDINQSIFGNFNFIERVFSSERDLGSPYYFSVLVAPTPAAIWDGPDGLKASVESVIEDIRPIGIFANVEGAQEVGVGLQAKLVVKGLPLPSGSRATVNSSQAARELRERIYARLRRYIDGLAFGEPVRAAEIMWTIMNEPGVVDVRDLTLLRYPAGFAALNLGAADAGTAIALQRFNCGANVDLQSSEIPVFVDMHTLPGAANDASPLLEIV
jgi:hypothetical protein